MLGFLQEQFDYIQNKQVYRRQGYCEKLEKIVNTNNITVLEWQRRVWKSSLIISYLQWNNSSLEKIFYINKELDVLDTIKTVSDLEEAFQVYKKHFWEPEYIIIDEIQDIDLWEKFVRKYSALQKYKIIITGSNSKLLSGELSSYLTGRYLTLEVFSFSYKEFLDFQSYENTEDHFREYCEFGWMPEILFIHDHETKKNYLKNVLSNILLKDIVARYNIRDIRLLEKILAFLSNNRGSLVSITNISNSLTNQFKKEYSTKTIADYMKYLEFPYLINEVPRYDIKWKKILEYVWKYYFNDIWIANTFWFHFALDIGKILENLVYLKFKQDGYTLYIGTQQDWEIDFIAEKDGEKVYIQVCYLLSSEDTIQREFWNLLKIQDNYRKIVVSMDKSFWNTYHGIESKHIMEFVLGVL